MKLIVAVAALTIATQANAWNEPSRNDYGAWVSSDLSTNSPDTIAMFWAAPNEQCQPTLTLFEKSERGGEDFVMRNTQFRVDSRPIKETPDTQVLFHSEISSYGIAVSLTRDFIQDMINGNELKVRYQYSDGRWSQTIRFSLAATQHHMPKVLRECDRDLRNANDGEWDDVDWPSETYNDAEWK